MSLRGLTLKRRYRSHEDDLLAGFYLPCLRESNSYSRAVGYFTSTALALAAQGLEPFIQAGGKMRIVASPELPSRDGALIEAGYEERQALVGKTATTQLLSDPLADPLQKRLGLLGWMIARNRLDIKLAVVEREGAAAGIYHEKVGVFSDAEGDHVVFHGSANESRGGLIANFESILVFRSWVQHERDDVEEFRTSFESLWANETSNLRIYSFPEAAAKQLISLAPEEVLDPSELEPTAETPTDAPAQAATAEARVPAIPEGIELRDYQREALRAWFSHDGRGILEMATGAGKTITALAAFERLYGAVSKQGGSLIGIVVCPYQHLVEQWASDAKAFGMDPILCYRSRTQWSEPLSAAIRAIGRRSAPAHLAIATNATFQSEAFRALLADCPEHSLLIADEVHNLGSPGLSEALPQQFSYRLGLSATPERYFDPEGTDAIYGYFGEPVFEFTLEDAIRSGALTPYDYAVSVVELEGDELDLYLDLTRKIGAAIGAGGLSSDAAQILLVARARVLANAHNKLGALREAIGSRRGETHQLVYCGDGSAQHDTGIEAERQIESVVRMLGVELGMRVHPYTAETDVELRERLRRRFSEGDLQALVAIRCLDEGVDIPATRNAFILASSKNPRQYIQRRGRVLRQSPGTGKTHAYVHDFLAVPPEGSMDEGMFETERKLVIGELKRVVGFAQLARNGPAALTSLQELRERYDLLHV